VRNAVTLFLTVTISAFLARRFARTSLELEAQLAQVRQLSAKELEHQRTEAELRLQHEQERARRALLEAEHDRKAKELEEARQLQLSLLPKKLPQLPQLDLAAYMKTASEVGGDYYDFHLGEDGTLTIAVGDATGHGLKAGTLVASVKSLFVSLACHPDIPHIFERMSRVLKEMKLRGLFMAMTMVKVNGHRLRESIAGMPSVFIYRASTGEIEEIAMRALPLGGVMKYQYQQQELTLAADDVVVLMSDGLPERFNAQGEMLDYAQIRQALPALAHQGSEAIIAELLRVGDEWGGGRPQDDDITFVVLKVK
jgi:serine phosphatase RsbU (regulator of sigma subunit)